MAGFGVKARDYGSPFIQRMEYSGTDVIYLGEAEPGSATSAAKWRIKKFTYDGSSNLTQSNWASGTDNCDKIWDNRATYTYS